jgi:hypothetical protein
MNTMSRGITFILMSIGITAAHAEPTIQVSPGTVGGVLSTRITTTMLSESDHKRMSAMPLATASADVYAGAVDITLNRNQQGIAKTVHSVCFETWLTTEADYKFVMDVGGHQVVMSDHIVIPNDRRTCIQHELYQRVSFPTPGAFSYYAITSGTTKMAGEKRATGRATITVR